MTRFSLYPLADSYLLVAVVAIVLLGLMLLIGPGHGRIAWPRRAALAALRIAVIVMVLAAMLRPTVIYTEIKKQSATLLLLADKSRSMSVPDAISDKTRWEALRHTVADATPALAELAEDFELKAYTFDAGVHPLEVDGGNIPLAELPDGRETAIGYALEDALRQEAGKRLLGLVLLSDGAQRAYAPRDLPPQTAAARLKHLGYPLFSFAFGQSRGLGQARDIAVKDLLVNQSVFVKNQLAVAGHVRIDGYVNREIPVKLLFETAPHNGEPGKMEVVAQQNLKATADGQLLPVELTYAPQVPGQWKLTLEATDQPGELVTTNNRLSTFVNVLSGGLNVLYLEGTLRVEQKFLRRALDGSPDINVDYVRIDPAKPQTRPGDLAERLRPGKYDVYILGDLDSTAFQGDELKDLAKTVDQGAGLIMLGGFHSFGPGGYASTPLSGVLPVEMDRFERQPLDEPIRKDLHLPGPVLMRPTRFGLLHFALMLAGDREANTALWAKLPPLEGANRFRNLKPGALPLAVDDQDRPLLVAQSYGNGRVLAFAGDSTWHWWMRGYESAHKRFWRQVILWLARKDQTTDGNVWVRLAKRRFAPGDRVEFIVGARSPTGEPVADAVYKARVVLPDGTRRPLQLVCQDDQMSGSFRESQTAGDYAIEVTAVTATHNAAELGSARARFLVFEQDLELDNAAADAATLESLAAMTGGESLAPEQLSQLIRRLARQTEHLEIKQETKSTFWDTWQFFLVLVGLLGIEWYLRKRWGLV